MKRIDVIPAESDAAVIPFARNVGVSLNGTRILALGGLGTLATAFALSAARVGASVILADLIAGSSREDALLNHAAAVCGAFAKTGAMVPLIYSCDVTEISDVVALMESVSQEQAIDVVVDFAGVHHPPMDLVKEDPEALARQFSRVVDVNLNGAFNVTVAAARVMVPHRNGHIIHLCSNGSRASLYGSYGYNASKHGTEGVVKTAAAQLAPFGVRVNGVAPGTVITDLNRSLSYDETGTMKPRARSILAHTPTKRYATAEGVAATILSMCVPQPHLTGNVVFCDDGYNIEGHSWPEGNAALYGEPGALDDLYSTLEQDYPRADRPAE